MKPLHTAIFLFVKRKSTRYPLILNPHFIAIDRYSLFIVHFLQLFIFIHLRYHRQRPPTVTIRYRKKVRFPLSIMDTQLITNSTQFANDITLEQLR